MRRIELLAALVMLGLSGLVLAESLKLATWTEFAPGPGFMPVLVAASGAGLAALLALQAWREADRPADLPDRRGLTRVLMTMAALWAVVVLTPRLGLITVAALFSAFMLLAVVRRPLLPSLVTTGLTMGLVWGVFVAWLGIALPRGPLGI